MSNLKNSTLEPLGEEWCEKESGYIGELFLNKDGKEFVVTGYFHRKKDNRKLLSILFPESGYEKFTAHSHVKSGLIVDRLSPNIFGIACIGYASTDDNRQEYNVWYNMLSRCHNNNDSSYERYGAKGVSVCKRWLRFDYFLEDFKNIDGYDEKLYKSGKLQLDKDAKQIHLPYYKRVYSLETCTLLTPLENANFVAPIKKGKAIVAFNQESGEHLEFKSITHFASEFGFPRRTVSTYYNEGKTYKGWILKGMLTNGK